MNRKLAWFTAAFTQHLAYKRTVRNKTNVKTDSMREKNLTIFKQNQHQRLLCCSCEDNEEKQSSMEIVRKDVIYKRIYRRWKTICNLFSHIYLPEFASQAFLQGKKRQMNVAPSNSIWPSLRQFSPSMIRSQREENALLLSWNSIRKQSFMMRHISLLPSPQEPEQKVESLLFIVCHKDLICLKSLTANVSLFWMQSENRKKIAKRNFSVS